MLRAFNGMRSLAARSTSISRFAHLSLPSNPSRRLVATPRRSYHVNPPIAPPDTSPSRHIRGAVENGIKSVVVTFVSAFAEKLAFYVFILGAISAAGYFTIKYVSNRKSKFLESMHGSMEDAKDSVGNKINAAKDGANRALQTGKDGLTSVSDTLHSAGSAVQHSIGDMRDMVSDKASGIGNKIYSMYKKTGDNDTVEMDKKADGGVVSPIPPVKGALQEASNTVLDSTGRLHDSVHEKADDVVDSKNEVDMVQNKEERLENDVAVSDNSADSSIGKVVGPVGAKLKVIWNTIRGGSSGNGGQ